jgi:hypothetical protein
MFQKSVHDKIRRNPLNIYTMTGNEHWKIIFFLNFVHASIIAKRKSRFLNMTCCFEFEVQLANVGDIRIFLSNYLYDL